MRWMMIFAAAMLMWTIPSTHANAAPAQCRTSQYGCVTVLQENGITFRDTEVESDAGTVTGVGTGSGSLGISDQYAMVYRQNTTDFYIHDVNAAFTCTKTLSTAGRPGVVWGNGMAYIPVFASNEFAWYSADCTGGITYLPTIGQSPASVTTDGIYVWYLTSGVSGNSMTLERMDPNSSNAIVDYTWGDDPGTLAPGQMCYESTSDSLYFPASDGVHKVSLSAPGSHSLWAAIGNMDRIGCHNGYVSAIEGAGTILHILRTSDGFDQQVSFISVGEVTVGQSVDGVTTYTKAIWPNGAPLHTWVWGHDVAGATATYNPVYDYGSGAETDTINYLAFMHPSTSPVCGNNLVESGETCDDGDTTPGDGCNASCQEESGWTCTGQPSSCTEDCGDSTIVGGELCDGANYGGNDCTTVAGGFTGGTLACNGTCDGWNTSSCTSYVCGNSSIEPGEDCDLANLGGQDCTDRGFSAGTLACDGSCNWDVSGCFDYVCGNNSIEPGEDCDNSNLGGQNCTTVPGGFTGGTLACNAGSCDWNVSGCWTCGDGDINTGEQCDDTNVGGQDCTSLGLGTGSVTCNANCTFNTSLCSAPPVCQNGAQEPGEQCDGADMGVQPNCTDHGFDGGSLVCTTSCTYDTSGCTNDPVCQNGLREGSEECDQLDLNGFDCTTIPGDFTGGSLGCTSSCTFDSSSCTGTQECQEADYLTLEVSDIPRDKEAEEQWHQTALDLHGDAQQCDSGCIIEDGHEITWWSTEKRCIGHISWTGNQSFELTVELFSLDGEEAIMYFRNSNPVEYLNFVDGQYLIDHTGENVTIWLGLDGVYAAGTQGTAGLGGISTIHPISGERSPLINPDQPDLGTVNLWGSLLPTSHLWNVGIADIPFDANSLRNVSFSTEAGQMAVWDFNASTPKVDSFESPFVPDPPKKDPKCSCSANGSPTGALPILFGFLFLVWSTRRKRK